MKRSNPPILDYPGKSRAILDPKQLYGRHPRIPKLCVLSFFYDLIHKRRRKGDATELMRLHGEGDPTQIFQVRHRGRTMALCFPGIGAPMAAATLEELVALGATHFISCGAAGVLDGSIQPGQVLLPTAALRDEGTSYHYQPVGRWSHPHPDAVSAILAACRKKNVPLQKVRSWTTDGVFRETPAKIGKRKSEGCACVEMEAAALFSVARFRNVTLGQILYAGDDVSGKTWKHRNWNRLNDSREQLLDLAFDACCLLFD
jgi:uridine phosphorylase